MAKAWLRDHSKDEIFASCREKRVPFAPVRTIDEVANDAHFAVRGYFVTQPDADLGAITYPGPPYRLHETPWRIERRAPALGAGSQVLGVGEPWIEVGPSRSAQTPAPAS